MDKGDTLLKLISSILDVTQIEAGKVRLTFEPMDGRRSASSSAVSSVKPQAQKKGAHRSTSSCRRVRWRSAPIARSSGR